MTWKPGWTGRGVASGIELALLARRAVLAGARLPVRGRHAGHDSGGAPPAQPLRPPCSPSGRTTRFGDHDVDLRGCRTDLVDGIDLETLQAGVPPDAHLHEVPTRDDESVRSRSTTFGNLHPRSLAPADASSRRAACRPPFCALASMGRRSRARWRTCWPARAATPWAAGCPKSCTCIAPCPRQRL